MKARWILVLYVAVLTLVLVGLVELADRAWGATGKWWACDPQWLCDVFNTFEECKAVVEPKEDWVCVGINE